MLFEETFGGRDLLRTWRGGLMPRAGSLEGGVEYTMRGVGCAVDYGDHTAAFDFLDREEIDFDARRLWL